MLQQPGLRVEPLQRPQFLLFEPFAARSFEASAVMILSPAVRICPDASSVKPKCLVTAEAAAGYE